MKKGHNADRHLCKSCQYRGDGTYGCNYICITEHSRGCKAEDCDKYVRGARIKSNEKAMRNMYGDYKEK